MSLYYVLDAHGCLAYSLEGGIIPPNAVLVDFDIGTPPTQYHRFHYTTREWVVTCSEQERAISEAGLAAGRRRELLQQSDWTDTLSAKNRLGQELYDQWQTYRQALRDVTAQPGYPFDIIWPTPPQ
jgi:hypothetical protein